MLCRTSPCAGKRPPRAALRLLVLVAGLACLPETPGADEAPTAPPASEVLPPSIQELMDALPGDPAVWERYLSDDAIYVSEAGDVAGKDELLQDFGPFPEGLSGSIEVRNPRITEIDDLAVVVFEAHEEQTVFDQRITVEYLISHVWRAEQGSWRLITLHHALLPQDPPPLPVDEGRLGDFVGTYELSGKWRYQVDLSDGGLAGGSEGGRLRALIPVGDNVFADTASRLGVLRIFVRGPDGAVESMILRRKFADLVWKRVPQPPQE